ncbi:MAG: metallophosphoesterase [Bacteroidota bacterium]
MRFILPLAILLLFDAFVFRAFSLVMTDWSPNSQLLVTALYWAIPLSVLALIAGLVWGKITSQSKHFLLMSRAMLIIAYISKFLIAIVLILDSFRSLIIGDGPSVLMAQSGIVLGSIPFVLLTYGILRNRHRYQLFNEKITIENLPSALDGLKIIQISDIHSGSFTQKEPIYKAIELINQQEADLVFFTGDLVNSVAAEMEGFVEVFDKIQARFGVYSIVGNHDYGDYVRWADASAKRQNFELLKEIHRRMGWDLMLNEHRLLEVNGEQVAIIGVENYSAHPRFPKYGDLRKAYEGTEPARLKLLLSHDPTHWEDEVIKEFKDIALTFSGHTHGFQFGIEIPGWIKWSPVKYVYKQWAGLYRQGEQFLYVNRGFGFLGYPGRVGILPEITLIELKKKDI